MSLKLRTWLLWTAITALAAWFYSDGEKLRALGLLAFALFWQVGDWFFGASDDATSK